MTRRLTVHLVLSLAAILLMPFQSRADDYSAAYQAYAPYADEYFRCLLPDTWEQLEMTPGMKAASAMSKVVVYRDTLPLRVSIAVEYYIPWHLVYQDASSFIAEQTRSSSPVPGEGEVAVKVNDAEIGGLKAKTFEHRRYKALSRFHRTEFRVLERFVVIPLQAGFSVLRFEAPEDIAVNYEAVFEKVVRSFEPIVNPASFSP